MPCRPVRVPAALRSPLVIGFAALVGTLAVAPAAHAGLSAPKAKPGPTVTFVGTGPAPLVCTSEPEPRSLTIPWNSWLNVVNHTGAAATLWLKEKPFELADGAGRAFKFMVSGPHTLTLVPDCLVTLGDAVPAAVEVGPSPEDESAPAAAPPPGEEGPPLGAPGPLRVDPTRPSVGNSRGQPLLPGLTASEEDYEAYGPFDAGPDGQGFRLLAIIAAICVFGVSVAIIRVILAQRATKSVDA